GICYMVDDKMCVGTMINKESGEPYLMARIGEELFIKNQHRKGCALMNFTGRPMKGFAFITPVGMDSDEDLAFWIDQALAYNPLAKKSKKRAKKKS
ncbi:MAG: RNA methyltransferase, partial [Bacteroidia bacterium]|nr:RNA methyltransferase [Bacteroidia bacterium]